MKYLILFFLGMSSALAQNTCGHNLVLGNATIQIQNGSQVIAQDYTISRSDSSNGRCSSYKLYFSKGLANSYQRKAFNTGGQTADYNLHQNLQASGTLKDLNDAASNTEFILGTTPDDDVIYSGVFYISVPGLSSQGTLASGTFTDNIIIRVFSVRNNGTETFEENQPFSVNLLNNVNIEVSIVSEGGQHNPSSTALVLDFGNLATNAELGADIRVSSNTPYQVRLSSLNNGALTRNTSSLAYALMVNNTIYSLASSSSTPVTVGNGTATGSTPARFNVKVRITGGTSGLVAGEYTDTITITTIAN